MDQVFRRKTPIFLTMKITGTAFVLLIQTLQCLASDDSPFQLTNTATGFCLVKTNNHCTDIRWTTGDRLLVQQRKKCLGVQGESVGSEISLYDCDENSKLQKWECKNNTVLALKGRELYIELTADNTAVLSKTIGPNNHLTISGTSSGACTRTYRELYAIGGNAAGMPCMFPFLYHDQWYSDCTTADSSEKGLWCAVETKYQNERWGYCPVTSKEGWKIHPTTGAFYQLNANSALTWSQADTSCKQQGASLLSITNPHEQAYVTALLGTGGNKLWTGLILDPEHGWKWSSGRPYRYLKWDSGHPLPNPGYNCAIFDPAVQYSWQSSPCSKKLGYICYSEVAEQQPTQAIETGFCSSPWTPYNGHCFHLSRTQKTWSDAQRQCRNDGGDLVSIRNVEDQSFVISQLGYASADELWIGLNDRKTEGLFDWSDHTTVSFTSWEFGKPSGPFEIKDCVLISGENGNWADRVCEEKHGFICMKMSASKPTGDEVEQDVGCKPGWRRHGSYCYFISTQIKTFDEAKDDCKSSGSYLADVSNGVDNAFLVSLVGLRPEKYFWLGLSNQKNIDEFVWTNTDSVRFTHWNAEMPGHQQGCVAMKTGIFAGLWDVLPCNNKVKYICKHLAEGAVLTPPPPTRAPTGCVDGWTPIGSRNYCFKLFGSEERTWYEARDYCKAIGGDLLSIHSEAELQQLPGRHETVWIGLSAPDPVTGYVWSDGSPVNFQHWEDGEPNNKNNVESCTEFKMYKRSSSGSWNDVHCETSHNWLCQIRAGVTPSPPPELSRDYNETSDGWLEWNGDQYYINSMSMAMEEARHYCQQKHGDLVTINSEAESVFLWKQISKSYKSYWIGLTVDLDSTFGWMDGSPVVFQRWDENQPNFQNNDENCAVMKGSMGFWHDYNCGYEHKSICKRSGSPPVNTTVAPTVPPTGGCPQNWKKLDSKCYNIITSQNETWEGARTQCKAMGGNLASILSRHVQVFLTTKMAKEPTKDLWIGLHTIKGGRFYWTDGRPMRYNNWGFELQNQHDRIIHRPFMYDYDFLTLHHLEMMHHHHHAWLSQEEANTNQCAAMTTNSKIGIGKWKKKSCSDTTGYICLRNVDASLPDSPEPTTTDYVKIFNDSIKFVTKQMTWQEAKKHCEGDGAKLANVRNEWTRVYVELMAIKAPLWIGVNKMETSGYFRYIDGWPITQSNWDALEPRMNQPCVFVNAEGKWKTADCNQNMTSVCMKSTDVPPTVPSDFPGTCPDDPDSPRWQRNSWLPFKGHCYLFLTERVEWPDASANCVRHGGTLASIEDPFEQAFIKDSIDRYKDMHESFWIGLYKTHKGMWMWLDKTAMDYTNWGEGQYSSNSYGAIQIADGRWTTFRSRYDRPYICKTSKVLHPAPPTIVSPGVHHQSRGRIILAVSLVIAAIAVGLVIVLFLFKKSGHRLPIPEKLTTFDNPLFFNNERSQPDLVDTSKLVANAEEETPGPVKTV
ncbi:macrophage mannose receptor 1-like [Micropterus salmoides]|uniref:macrophage mannose receptor 1-like n=1 Tax=Micropterus salmoides TaxID=27706 RepID=UPI0018EC203C|nr:macrophage mannose receptor 1-like [Micropterus salmoides]